MTKPKATGWWLNPKQCGACSYCGMEPDCNPYCTHPKVKKAHPSGLNINAALSDYCRKNGRLTLWKGRTTP